MTVNEHGVEVIGFLWIGRTLRCWLVEGCFCFGWHGTGCYVDWGWDESLRFGSFAVLELLGVLWIGGSLRLRWFEVVTAGDGEEAQLGGGGAKIWDRTISECAAILHQHRIRPVSHSQQNLKQNLELKTDRRFTKDSLTNIFKIPKRLIMTAERLKYILVNPKNKVQALHAKHWLDHKTIFGWM